MADAVIAALEGRSNGEICFCETQTDSEIRSKAAGFGTVEDRRAEQPDFDLFAANL